MEKKEHPENLIRKTAVFLIRRSLSLFCRLLRLCFGHTVRPEHPRTVLVIAAGYIGDTFWAVQTASCLKKRWPEAQIHWVGRGFLRDLAFGRIPDACLHTVPVPSDRNRDPVSFSRLRREAASLRKTVHPEIVLDLMGNRYSAFFAFFLRGFSIGPDLAEETASLYDETVSLKGLKPEHLAIRPFRIAGMPADFQPETFIPAPPVPRFSRQEILAKLNLPEPEKAVLLLPGAGWPAKQWPIAKFRVSAEKLIAGGFSVLFAGNREEYEELCRPAAENLPGARALCLPLGELFSLLPHLGGCIGSDSGITHIAAAEDLPTVTLFCPTNPVFSRPLGACGLFLQAACPKEFREKQYCSVPPLPVCTEPCRMALSPEQVLAAFYEAGRRKSLKTGSPTSGGIPVPRPFPVP